MEIRSDLETTQSYSPYVKGGSTPLTKQTRSGAPLDIKVRVASQDDYQQCRDVMRAASRNYSFASLFFPREVRPHVEALYAFMRIGDDRVDVSHKGFRSPQEAIEDWEETYWNAFTIGDSPHPVIRAYLDTANEFGIPAELMKPYFKYPLAVEIDYPNINLVPII